MVEIRLSAVLFCQPQAKYFSGRPLSDQFRLPERLPASPELEPGEIQNSFISSYLRTADVPLAFHRESIPQTSIITSHSEMMEKLESHGRMLQYRFSDGKILTAHQILYHAYGKLVPRHLLPLLVNIRSDLLSQNRFGLSAVTKGARPSWQTQAEQVIISTLISGLRAMKVAEQEGETFEIFFTLDDCAYRERQVVRIEKVELRDEIWGPWRLSTDLPEPVTKTYYGRARLELDATELGDLTGLATGFHIDPVRRRLMFHTFQAQIKNLEAHITKAPFAPQPETESVEENLAPDAAVQTGPLGQVNDENGETIEQMVASPAQPYQAKETALQMSEVPLSRLNEVRNENENTRENEALLPQFPVALETGISIHLSGHGSIQTTLSQIDELLKKEERSIQVYPGRTAFGPDKLKPRLNLSGDGSFRFITQIETDQGIYEAHGFPQSSAYLVFNLQFGLGATTGLSNNQIAHPRKGLKRERDMKVLRNLGFASMIFYDAANFALGHPLSDGTIAKTERDVLDSIFNRLGALILKSEGWPIQTGSLETLCSLGLVTLIEGFVSQVVCDVKGRAIHLYVPAGEWQLTGLSKSVVQVFHAFVSDLAHETSGSCFTRARTKYFESFLSGRSSPEREDIAVRFATEPEVQARMIYQPVVADRYVMPESSRPPRGHQLLALLHQGFEMSYDGKQIEEFNASDFRPEFELKDGHDEDAAIESIATGPRKIDWFELHPKFFFKGTEITADQASRLSREGMMEFQGRLFRVKPNDLPSLKRLTQFWSSIQGHNAGLLRGKRRRTEETYFHVPRSQTLDLLALRASGVKVQGGKHWTEICEFYDSLNKEREPLVLPETFKASLQPYQASGVQWLGDLHQLGLGGILADDMGLGKTVTSLAFLETLRAREQMGACLVLVPTSLTYNWLSEASRFAPEMPTLIFSSREPDSMLDFIQNNRDSLIICTYGLLQESAELFQQVQWNCIVFDEAQNLKNITTKRTTAARRLPALFKLCLTGTPLENHYGEFYSLFDLTVPGSLGDLPSFRERYVNPERVLRSDLDYLRLKTRPLILRRTKAQVMHELPPKIETTIKLPFEEEQKRIYRDIAAAYNQQIRNAIATQGEGKSQLQMLTALLRLRQACSDPSAIPGVTYGGEPPKISTLIEALTDVTQSGESALVFTQFLATYDRIRSKLTKAGISFYDINGADSRLTREKKLQAFKDEPGGSVMLMTLKTGGVGLNLTKASYIFHVEPWWNPAVENQATDRAHRIGQVRTVQVYRYLIQDSVEEKIEILKGVKSQRFDALFSVDESESDLGGPTGTGSLSQQDFEYLLS